MAEIKPVKVTNKGMVSIPAAIRKQFGLKDGSRVVIMVDLEGSIRIIPCESENALRARSITLGEFNKIEAKLRQEELELER